MPYGRALFARKNTATDIYCNRAGRIHPPAIYVIAYDYSLCRCRRVAAPLQKGIEEIKSWGKSDKFVLQALNFGVPPSRLPCRKAVIGRLCPPETPDSSASLQNYRRRCAGLLRTAVFHLSATALSVRTLKTKAPSPKNPGRELYRIYYIILFVHCAAALLVFLSASARAGVVRADLYALADGASLFAAV